MVKGFLGPGTVIQHLPDLGKTTGGSRNTEEVRGIGKMNDGFS